MNEQAAGFAAEIYAKVKNKPGVALATSGPGGQNLLTAIANCYYDSVPCIFSLDKFIPNFSGQIPLLGKLDFKNVTLLVWQSPLLNTQ